MSWMRKLFREGEKSLSRIRLYSRSFKGCIRCIMQDKGFTLLEVMISVAIMAIVLTPLLTMHNRSLEFMYTSSKMSTATMLAKGIMEKVEIEGFPDTTYEAGQVEEEGYEDMKWEAIVSDTSLEKLRKIDVKVSWKSGTEDRYVRLVSFAAEK